MSTRLLTSRLDDAINRGALEEVRALLDLGAALDGPDEGGDTPLISAAWVGSHEIVALLLQRGADINAVGADGRGALQRLLTNHQYWYEGHDACVALLRGAGAQE